MSCEPTMRSADVIKRLNARVRELENSQKDMRWKSSNFELDAKIAQGKLQYTEGLLALKDDVLAITSREHVRFMQMYLDRENEMQTLRETNETLVKKILELAPVIYNVGGGNIIQESVKKELTSKSLPSTATFSRQPFITSFCPCPLPSTPAACRPAPSANPPLRMVQTRKLDAQTDA